MGNPPQAEIVKSALGLFYIQMEWLDKLPFKKQNTKPLLFSVKLNFERCEIVQTRSFRVSVCIPRQRLFFLCLKRAHLKTANNFSSCSKHPCFNVMELRQVFFWTFQPKLNLSKMPKLNLKILRTQFKCLKAAQLNRQICRISVA